MQVNQAVDCGSLQAQALASLIGKIISMSIATGPVTSLMTRNLYAMLNSHQAWCDNLELSADAKSELLFWAQELTKFNGHDIWPSPSAIRMVYTNASQSGYRGYTVDMAWLSHSAGSMVIRGGCAELNVEGVMSSKTGA